MPYHEDKTSYQPGGLPSPRPHLVDHGPSPTIDRTFTVHSRHGSADGLFPYRLEKHEERIEVLSVPSYASPNPNPVIIERLRINDDGLDHVNFEPTSLSFIMTTAGCAMALAGSQIVPLLYLTVGSRIAYDLKATPLLVWLLSSILVSQGVFAPFVGHLADLFGRKTFFLAALAVNVLGCIVCSLTPTAGGFMAGQMLFGFGTITEETLSIAVVGESVPTSKRPYYAALILTAIIPWAPGTLYANLITLVSWRYIGLALGIWNIINFVILAVWYRPPPRYNTRGLTRKEMLKRIDFTGGGLLTLGLVFFLIGVNWGGNTYPWNSSHVVTFLVLGLSLFVGFGIWEWKFVRYPLFPRRIIHKPRAFTCMLIVIFMASVNWIALVIFWPIQTISVFDAGRLQVGIYSIPIALCMLSGAMLSAVLLGLFQRHVVLTMFLFCCMQTIASACLSLIDPHNIRTAWAPVVLALVGVGGVLVPNQVIITVITPDELIASVTALTVGLRSAAQVIGVALYYNRFVAEVTQNTFDYVVPVMLKIHFFHYDQVVDMMWSLSAHPFKEYAQRFPQLMNASHYELVHQATVKAFSHSYERVYLITIAFGVVACLAAAAMGDISSYMDDHVAVPVGSDE